MGVDGEGPGTGDAVFGTVAFDPWSTEPGPDWNVAGGSYSPSRAGLESTGGGPG